MQHCIAGLFVWLATDTVLKNTIEQPIRAHKYFYFKNTSTPFPLTQCILTFCSWWSERVDTSKEGVLLSSESDMRMTKKKKGLDRPDAAWLKNSDLLPEQITGFTSMVEKFPQYTFTQEITPQTLDRLQLACEVWIYLHITANRNCLPFALNFIYQ